MTKQLVKVETWYQDLLSDLKKIAWTRFVELKHAIGERIIKDELKFGKPEYGSKRIEELAKDLSMNSREIYRCIQFVKKFPTLSYSLAGLTWKNIVNKYLPEPKVSPVTQLPSGKYQVLYADPPWPYNERQDEKNLYGNATYHYPTMSIEELKKMPVKELRGENSVLFMWVATHFLQESFEVIKSWGFDYKSQMVWVKNGGQGGIGWYCWGDHEVLMVATAGSFLPKKLFSSVYQSPRGKHSQKPDYYYEMIEKMYPVKKYLELFARNDKKRPKWNYWGNEAKV